MTSYSIIKRPSAPRKNKTLKFTNESGRGCCYTSSNRIFVKYWVLLNNWYVGGWFNILPMTSYISSLGNRLRWLGKNVIIIFTKKSGRDYYYKMPDSILMKYWVLLKNWTFRFISKNTNCDVLLDASHTVRT